MKRILAVLAIAFALLIPASAANAAPPPGCITPYVCLYANLNYGGFSTFYNVTAAANQGCKNLSSGLNNNIESVYGNYVGAGKIVIYFNAQNCQGSAQWSSTGGAYPDVSPYRNSTTSIKILSLP